MMTRKEFIKKCGLLGVSVPFMGMLLESCEGQASLFPEFEVNFSGKVLVVGAGAAGITAGYLLDRYNIDFQIIEASSIHGGRVKRTTGFADFPIDLGGEWIHQHPSVLARLISNPSIDADVDIIAYSPETVYNWKNGKLKKQNWASNFYSEYKFKSTTWFGFFENHMMPQIRDRVIYDSPVTEIDRTGNTVIVRNSADEVFEADKVLITVPVSILQKGNILFNPELPKEKINAINAISMPDGIKVFISFSEKFYPDILFTGGLLNQAESSEKIYYDAAFRKNTNSHILGLFTVGQNATPYATASTDEDTIGLVMDELDEIFKGEATKYYQNHIIQNWSKEPYIQGSYSIDFNGSQSRIVDDLAAPINNQLFFAGEATNKDNGSTVDGASESAYFAVEKILAQP